MTPEEWLVALGGSSNSGNGTRFFKTADEWRRWKAELANGSR